MNKLLITLIFGILLLSFSSAYLGSYKQGECIPIVTNLNASAVNITVLTSPTPNAQILLSNVEMTKSGSAFNYSFCNTVKLGTYTYGYCDSSGNCYSNDFDVTPSGNNNILGFFILIIVMIYAVAFVGFFGKNEWVTILGGMAMIGLGLFTINNGIDLFRNQITDIFSWTTIAIGAFFTLYASVSVIQDNL